jgi:glyoxylase-like metal-dependent hydrolase (beta-lactamase superfamily II)
MDGYKVLRVGPLGVNCTVVYSDGEATVIDPGAEAERIADFLKETGLKLKYILLTHGHVDHFGAAERLRELTSKAPLFVHEGDLFLLKDELWPGFASYLGASLNPSVEGFLREGLTFNVGKLELKVFETPGHSPGSVVFDVPRLNLLVAGDLLFRSSVGRWDLPGGNLEELRNSLRRVFSTFPETRRVITGHYETTTLGYERKYNPHILELLG